jgi:hypothetical protein
MCFGLREIKAISELRGLDRIFWVREEAEQIGGRKVRALVVGRNVSGSFTAFRMTAKTCSSNRGTAREKKRYCSRKEMLSDAYSWKW